MITQDEYSTVINSDDTYEGLAKLLSDDENGRVILAWTDQEGTQLDILMVRHPDQYGLLQRGMRWNTDLFVAVSSFGMFGFKLNGNEKFPDYVGEKLGLERSSTTTIKLAELINGVCRELEK